MLVDPRCFTDVVLSAIIVMVAGLSSFFGADGAGFLAVGRCCLFFPLSGLLSLCFVQFLGRIVAPEESVRARSFVLSIRLKHLSFSRTNQ